MKQRFNSFINLIKTNKRVRYLVTLSVLILFVLALNVTYSAFTSNNTNDVANIKIKDLAYNMQVNDVNGNIMIAYANSYNTYSIKITALNSMMTKYELTYKVCATSACTSYIDTPSGLKVRYEEISSPVNGNIASTETRIIGLATENNLSTTYYI